jgi:peptidoglycan/xylan/chitin deacetylase (PgdA/CDA1 family)
MLCELKIIQRLVLSSLCYLRMKNCVLSVIVSLFCHSITGQSFDINSEATSLDYCKQKSNLIEKLKDIKAESFGEFTPGIMTRISSSKKMVALTFDACGGPTGSGFDSAMINFLKKEKIEATLFVSGLWIEKNDSLFRQLCTEPLFEIENHGLFHRPCSISGKSRYGLVGTETVNDVFDEVELNARQIEFYNKKKPRFYRPAAAAADEGCIAVAKELNEKVITYDVLSGDAVPDTKAEEIKRNILKKTRPGSIIIMHMNHPERNGFEALIEAVPELRKQGYTFVKLESYPLVGKN